LNSLLKEIVGHIVYNKMSSKLSAFAAYSFKDHL